MPMFYPLRHKPWHRWYGGYSQLYYAVSALLSAVMRRLGRRRDADPAQRRLGR